MRQDEGQPFVLNLNNKDSENLSPVSKEEKLVYTFFPL